MTSPSGKLWEQDYMLTEYQRMQLFVRCQTWCLWFFTRVVSK